MAVSEQSFSAANPALQQALPQLYKFALVLTANEQLARALLRAVCKSLASQKKHKSQERDAVIDAAHRMYTLWVGKLAEDPQLHLKNPPEPRLFSAIPVKGATSGNLHFAKFISNLPFQQRAALYLVYGEGASYDEAADVISLNVLALMKILTKGHVALAHWLDYRGLAPEAGGVAKTGVNEAMMPLDLAIGRAA